MIITIIILVILAAVSINAAYNSGIINYAVNGTQEYVQGAHAENTALANAEGLMDSVMARIESVMNEQGGSSQGGGSNSIAPGETASANSTYTSGTGANEKTAVIPEGFTVSGISGEQSIDSGLVIYDLKGVSSTSINWSADTNSNSIPDVQENYNQFVWVPVETAYVTAARIGEIIQEQEFDDVTTTSRQKAINYLISQGTYPMAVQLEDGENYRGILYNFESVNYENTAVTITCYADFSLSGSLNYYDSDATYPREPAYLTDSSDGDASSSNTLVSTKSDFRGILQEEYNAMVGSVALNGGFWIARYEITTDSNARITRGKTVATAASDSLNSWYGLYRTCREMYNTSSYAVQSTMISGSQYDQIMIWMRGLINEHTDPGDYENQLFILNANGTTLFHANQVYDLGTAMYEWTTTAYDAYLRGYKGGEDAGNIVPSYWSSFYEPVRQDNDKSSRPALYIKRTKADTLTTLASTNS